MLYLCYIHVHIHSYLTSLYSIHILLYYGHIIVIFMFILIHIWCRYIAFIFAYIHVIFVPLELQVRRGDTDCDIGRICRGEFHIRTGGGSCAHGHILDRHIPLHIRCIFDIGIWVHIEVHIGSTYPTHIRQRIWTYRFFRSSSVTDEFISWRILCFILMLYSALNIRIYISPYIRHRLVEDLEICVFAPYRCYIRNLTRICRGAHIQWIWREYERIWRRGNITPKKG